MKKTKIVATIGPASSDPTILKDMIFSGVNVCRLNFSHGTHESHKKTIDMIKSVREELSKPIAIMLDTKGPEIRLGDFKDEEGVFLTQGDTYVLTGEEVLGDAHHATVSYEELAKDVAVGDHILIDDGLVDLEVTAIDGLTITTKVLNDGQIKGHKGVNVPGAKVRLPAMTKKDEGDILFGIEEGVDFIAASFIRRSEDVLAIRKFLEENGGESIRIISKIENGEGVENMDDIIRTSDGVMVARGDLGVEIDPEEIPLVQKDMITKCVAKAKPVITATQMLDSMMRNPRPTRAEVTDVANAIFDGTSAIMLSGETASGKYPVQAVKTMARIALRTEEALPYDDILTKGTNFAPTTTNAIGRSTCFIARDLKAKAILTATSSGYTSRAIAKFRPAQMIIAATTSEDVCRSLSLDWGVEGIVTAYGDTTDSIIHKSIDKALEANLLTEGDLVVLTAGVPVGVSGTTNLIKVHTIARTLATGMGLGEQVVSGRAFVAQDDNLHEFQEGDILIVDGVDGRVKDLVDKATGLVAREGGLTCPSAIVALHTATTSIVGVEGLESLIHKSRITLDPESGRIFDGDVDIK